MRYHQILKLIDIILIVSFYVSVGLSLRSKNRFKLFILFCALTMVISIVRSLEYYFVDSIVWLLFSGLYLYSHYKYKTAKS